MWQFTCGSYSEMNLFLASGSYVYCVEAHKEFSLVSLIFVFKPSYPWERLPFLKADPFLF